MVGGNPFAVRFDGHRGKPDIRNQIACRGKRSAQIREDLPMAGTGRNNMAIGLLANLPHELKCPTNWTGRREYARMGHNAKETAQHLVADAVRLAAFDDFLNPLPITHMIHRVFAMGLYEHMDIGQNHAPCSIKASNAAELFKSTPGRTPWPPTVVR